GFAHLRGRSRRLFHALMQLLAYVAQNLAGAWLLMRGRPEGLNRLDLSLEGFWRSFAAIVLVAPAALLAALSQGWFADAAAAGAPPDPNLPLTLLALAVDWTAFPLLFAVLARPLGLGARYVPFIAARNWAAVIVSAMVAVLHALHLAGVLPSQPV